jgi:hypothetical protein
MKMAGVKQASDEVLQSGLLGCERQATRVGGSTVNSPASAELSVELQLRHSWLLLVVFVDQG